MILRISDLVNLIPALLVFSVPMVVIDQDPLETMRLAHVVDGLNARYKAKVELLALKGKGGQIPLRIPFGPPDEAS